MDFCLHCGTVRKRTGRRPSYPCPAGCGRQTVKVSANCRELAKAFHQYGFRVKSVTAAVTKIPAAGAEVITVTVAFDKPYPYTMFENIPESWHSALMALDHILAETEATELIYCDNFWDFGFYPNAVAEMKAVIDKLHKWLINEKEAGRWAVYTLTGDL